MCPDRRAARPAQGETPSFISQAAADDLPTSIRTTKDHSMPSSISAASVSAFEIGLNALSAILDKAEAFAASKKIDAAVLLRSRLAPDMFDLTRQVQTVTDQARRGAARLAGVEPPSVPDTETTIDQLKARIASTLTYLKTLDRKQIDASADREIKFPLGGGTTGQMKGADYLNFFVLPNYYFHLTAAYAILRHCGVEIGKRDFIGSIPLQRL
jgi:uncharacterized protein